MSKILPVFAILFLLNCDGKNDTKKSDEQTDSPYSKIINNDQPADINSTEGSTLIPVDYNLDNVGKVEYAKSIIDQTNSLVKKGILKQMNSSEVNERINPLMMKYDSIITKLSSDEMKEVEIYRTKELNKTIEMQVENR